MVSTSEEVCATPVSRPAIPTGQVIIEAALTSEVESNANNSIKIFIFPPKSTVCDHHLSWKLTILLSNHNFSYTMQPRISELNIINLLSYLQWN